MLSGGRAPSSEFGPNPEYSPPYVKWFRTRRVEKGWRRDAAKLSENRVYALIMIAKCSPPVLII